MPPRALVALAHLGYVVSFGLCVLGTTCVFLVAGASLLLDVFAGCFAGDLPERLRKTRV